jgi:hypothetical protein
MSTSGKRYAVVSCHVERPLDDRVWAAFGRLQERRPGGFAVAALMRPPDDSAGEDEARWVERAREAASRGPFGHHTHWTSPTHARPTDAGDPGDRVRREGAWLREQGLAPTLFCGGGWYTDASVAAACAELGYVDCTPRTTRPGYLAPSEPWAELAQPAWVRTGSGARVLCVPTSRTIGDLGRAVLRPSGLAEPVVHVYLHDTDLLDRRRRSALLAGLAVLARRRSASDLEAVAASVAASAPELAWEDVARGAGGSAGPE